jgi:hypothetical protein
VFREGAITLSAGAQREQLQKFKAQLDDGLKAVDYVALVSDSEGLADEEFRPLAERAIEVSKSVGVQVVFLVVGSRERPDQSIPAAAGAPVFYLRNGFGEKDLEPFRAYIAQDMKAGFRQP